MNKMVNMACEEVEENNKYSFERVNNILDQEITVL